MSEETQNPTQMLVIGLAVIAVLLAAIVGVLIYKQSTALPPVSAPGSVSDPAAAGGAGAAGGATGATGGQTAPDAAPVDPKSATKVPEGTEPADFVASYYAACDKGDWAAAFDLLPASKKAGNSPDALKEQVTGYGVKSATVTGSTEQGDKLLVTAEQVTASYGTFVNTWTFEQKDGTWFVADKAVTGMK